MIPLLVAVVVVFLVMGVLQRNGRGVQPSRPDLPSLGTRGRKIAKRIVVVASAWIGVTAGVSFFDISWGVIAGVVTVLIGAFWVWKTADPMQIDMDDLDRELMQLLEDES
ncbi:MAG: hypothetical protein OEX04_03525 [Acidimicrobiia bacterium]|nr:hypothetical protein [Acidimicrobiia bacterium]MDH5292548.1 hypothetical protein [Acidimicrobiia bacterium]